MEKDEKETKKAVTFAATEPGVKQLDSESAYIHQIVGLIEAKKLDYEHSEEFTNCVLSHVRPSVLLQFLQSNWNRFVAKERRRFSAAIRNRPLELDDRIFHDELYPGQCGKIISFLDSEHRQLDVRFQTVSKSPEFSARFVMNAEDVLVCGKWPADSTKK
jgi:hypothetical protein